MIVNTDIDIDVADRTRILSLIPNVAASINRDGRMIKHNTGVYFHEMPVDPMTGTSTIDHKEAEEMGFFKLDILNVSIYHRVKSNEEMDELLAQEPMWELLEHREVVSELFHLHSHFDVVKRMKPRNLEQLAAVLAVIRPAKRYLVGQPWDVVLKEAWTKPENEEYYFKKSHSFGYAMAIVLQLNLICRDSLQG